MEGSVYQYYANVRTEPVEWLWYPYIPLGKLTVLQGDPGEGKSTFALNVVARITTGQPMPDGVPAKGKRVAIYQCAEDGIADTIKPRLQQAGADCERVAYIIDNDIAQRVNYEIIKKLQKDFDFLYFITTLQAQFDYIPMNRKLIPIEEESLFTKNMYVSYLKNNEEKALQFIDWAKQKLIDFADISLT